MRPTRIVNKGSKQVRLPDKKAMNQLTRGDSVQQSLGNYAKLTPSGASASYSDILQQGDDDSE